MTVVIVVGVFFYTFFLPTLRLCLPNGVGPFFGGRNKENDLRTRIESKI